MLLDAVLGIVVVILVVLRFIGFYGILVGGVSLVVTVASILLSVDRLPVRDTDAALTVSAAGTAICGILYLGSFFLTRIVAANIGWSEEFEGFGQIPLAIPVAVVVVLAAAVYVHHLTVEIRRTG